MESSDFGTFGHPVSESDEDIDDLPHGLSQRMQGGNLYGHARQRHIDTLPLPPLLELGSLEQLPPSIHGSLDGTLYFVRQLADGAAFLLLQLPQGAASARQRRFAPQNPDLGFVQRGEIGRSGDPFESLASSLL